MTVMISTPTVPPTLDIAPPHERWNHVWDRFALARVKNDIHLVQVSSDTPLSPLTAVDARVFRHEFINIYQLSEVRMFHPSDFAIIEYLDDSLVCFEEENGTVFLAKELMGRISKLSQKLLTIRTSFQQQNVRSRQGRYSAVKFIIPQR